MGNKSNFWGRNDNFFGVISNLSFVLLILVTIVIFGLLYNNHQSFESEKDYERLQEINDLNEELKREREEGREREREKEIKSKNERNIKDNNPAENTVEPEKVRKIICPNCNGTSSEILPCGHCNYNRYGERQGSGGYTEYSRTGKDINVKPCSYCKGRGELPRTCRACGGEGRVDEYK